MLKFLLYCDLSTMKCTVADIEKELSRFASSFVKVNNSLWFFKYPNSYDGSPLPKEEHLFLDYFDKFTHDDSIIYMEKISDNYYFNLPDDICGFLEQD